MPPHVLIADDDPELLRGVAETIASAGFAVTCADSGAELIEQLGGDRTFDLIVTDVSMPWMTGLQAMHCARYAGRKIPVVVITALRERWVDEQVASLGDHVALLHKPFSSESLLRAIHELLPHDRAAGAPSPA